MVPNPALDGRNGTAVVAVGPGLYTFSMPPGGVFTPLGEQPAYA